MSEESLSYDAHIKPLFRPRDQKSMKRMFDLWSYDDVSEHADAILTTVEAGDMPCDGAWPEEQVELFRRWVAQGKPA